MVSMSVHGTDVGSLPCLVFDCLIRSKLFVFFYNLSSKSFVCKVIG